MEMTLRQESRLFRMSDTLWSLKEFRKELRSAKRLVETGTQRHADKAIDAVDELIYDLESQIKAAKREYNFR